MLFRNKERERSYRVIMEYERYSDDEIIAAIHTMMEHHYSKLRVKQREDVSRRLLDMKWDKKYICTYVIGTRPNPGFFADQIMWMGYPAAKQVFEGCWDVMEVGQRPLDAVERFDAAFQKQLERDRGRYAP